MRKTLKRHLTIEDIRKANEPIKRYQISFITEGKCN
jgi:hypothetical protein